MAKFGSPMVVKRKLQVEFDKDTPNENYIKFTFQRFCETNTIRSFVQKIYS
jgi:hypothetical protein